MAKKKTGVELEFSILDEEFKSSIKEMNTSIASMRKELGLENEVLKSSNTSVAAYENKLDTLKQQQEITKQKIEEATKACEKAKSMFGENSIEVSKYKNIITQAQTEHQKITNEIEKTTSSLEDYQEKLKREEEQNKKANSSLGTLTNTIIEQKEKLEELKEKYVNSILEQGKSSTQTKELKSQIKSLSSELEINETRLDMANNQLTEFAKESDNAGNHAVTFGEMIKANVISDVIKKGFSELIDLTKSLGASLISLGKDSFNLYADYEQLIGGVETLFKDSADVVSKYANDAYKTAGLNANEYMETVTSFSASLLQSLNNDTAKVAKVADMAITDMSDNANKMGTDMSLIQNAYQGFAKQNYTMLDNLKLGYGGTKSEMERLLADAQKISKVKYDISNLSDVYNAIHVIQTEMGITGTTSKEASTTIQGSVASMKSAWQNLLTGIADENADYEQLVNNFVDSIVGENGEGGVLNNIVPRIKSIVSGAKTVLSELWKELPKISEEIPKLKPFTDALQWIKDNGHLIVSTLTGLTATFVTFKAVSTITSIINGFKDFLTVVKAAKGAMSLFNGVMSANPILLVVTAVAGLVAVFVTLWNTSEEFRNFWIGLWDGIKNAVGNAADGIKNFASDIKNYVSDKFTNIKEFINEIIDDIVGFFQKIPDKFNEIIDSIKNWFIDLGTDIDNFNQKVVEYIESLPEKISQFVSNVISFLDDLPAEIGFLLGQALGYIANFGVEAYNWSITEIPKIVDSIINFFMELPANIWNTLVDAYNAITNWGFNTVTKGAEIASEFFNSVVNFFKELPGNIWNFLTSTYDNVAEWGTNTIGKGVETASNFISGVVGIIKELPSDVWNWLVNTISKVDAWKDNLINKGTEAAKGLFNAIVDTVKKIPSEMLNIGKNIVEGLWNGIKGSTSWITNKIKDFGSSFVSGFRSVFGIHSPSTVLRDQVGINLAKGVVVGFTDEMKESVKDMQDSIPTDFNLQSTISAADYLNNNFKTNSTTNSDITDTSSYNPEVVSPIYLTIEHFENNREQDVEDLAEELESYRRRKAYGKGTA